MSGAALQLLTVLANGWLAGSTLLLLAVAVDRPALLPARARHLVVLSCLAGTSLLATAAGAWWGEGLPIVVGGHVLREGEVPVGPLSRTAAWIVPVWVLLAAVLLVREGLGHLRLRRLRRSWRPAGRTAREAVGWHADLPLLTGPGGTPVALGLLRPVVYLPDRTFRELSPAGMRAVAAHEHAHATWRDPATWAAARVARILLWPVAPLWILERRLHRAAEEAADAAATAGGGAGERSEYCRTLLAVAGWRRELPAPGQVPAVAAGPLEGRLRRILRPRRSGRRGRVVAVALFAAAYPVLVSLPWAGAGSLPLDDDAASAAAFEVETFVERLREGGMAVSREGEDRIRIVIPEGAEEMRRIVHRAVVEERLQEDAPP